MLTDSTGRLLFNGPILDILNNRGDRVHIMRKYRRSYLYFPDLTAAQGETREGFGKVFFSDSSGHAEQKVIQWGYLTRHSSPGYLTSITTSYSPCSGCTQMILDQLGRLASQTKPVIRIGWVYRYPRDDSGRADICRLLQHGFTVRVWDSVTLVSYLLNHAPNQDLKDSLEEAVHSSAAALYQRDLLTQRLIDGACRRTFGEESISLADEEEVEKYYSLFTFTDLLWLFLFIFLFFSSIYYR